MKQFWRWPWSEPQKLADSQQIVRIYDQGQAHDWPLDVDRVIYLRGTEIEIFQTQVRVRKDPSPRQYCVKQGWLRHVGDVAVCAPSHIRVEILDGMQTLPYDHLSF